jgi:hypothetical protein
LWKKAVSPNGSTKCGVNGETVAKFTDDDLLGFESVHDGWLVFRLTRYGAASSLAWNPISGAARGHWRGHAGRKKEECTRLPSGGQGMQNEVAPQGRIAIAECGLRLAGMGENAHRSKCPVLRSSTAEGGRQRSRFGNTDV